MRLYIGLDNVGLELSNEMAKMESHYLLYYYLMALKKCINLFFS